MTQNEENLGFFGLILIWDIKLPQSYQRIVQLLEIGGSDYIPPGKQYIPGI